MLWRAAWPTASERLFLLRSTAGCLAGKDRCVIDASPAPSRITAFGPALPPAQRALDLLVLWTPLPRERTRDAEKRRPPGRATLPTAIRTFVRPYPRSRDATLEDVVRRLARDPRRSLHDSAGSGAAATCARARPRCGVDEAAYTVQVPTGIARRPRSLATTCTRSIAPPDGVDLPRSSSMQSRITDPSRVSQRGRQRDGLLARQPRADAVIQEQAPADVRDELLEARLVGDATPDAEQHAGRTRGLRSNRLHEGALMATAKFSLSRSSYERERRAENRCVVHGPASSPSPASPPPSRIAPRHDRSSRRTRDGVPPATSMNASLERTSSGWARTARAASLALPCVLSVSSGSRAPRDCRPTAPDESEGVASRAGSI